MSRSSFYADGGPGQSDLQLLDWYLAEMNRIYNEALALYGQMETLLAQAQSAADSAADSATGAAASAALAESFADAAENWYNLTVAAASALTLGGLLDVDLSGLATGDFLKYNGTNWVNGKPTESIIIACSDETTALTAGTAKTTFRMPYGFVLTGVRASLTTAQTSGSIFTVDINYDGGSILSTKLTIDNTEKTSTTAATPAVILTPALFDDGEITVDIDQIGDGTAKGLKVYLIGHQ